MVVNDRPCKRARRNRVTTDLHDFHAFPSGGETPDQPFREGVSSFLDRHARPSNNPLTSHLFPPLMTWQVPLRSGEAVVALDVIEEDVSTSARSVHCNQCRVVGWSGHPVCRKRYHFIIRADGGVPSDGYKKSCDKCANPLQLPDRRCKWCETVVTTEDVEEWVYSQLDDNNTHLLHGLVHSNGFGHLLRLNGKEGGSKLFSGHDIMDFWDRLCNFLSVRKVSVMDVSRKYGTEYRLLHAITKGCSWYGEWGYEFGNGSYALTLDAYRKSIDTLSSVALAPILNQRRRQRTPLQETIAYYQSLSGSELTNLRELLSFLLKLIHGSVHPKLAGATPECIDHDASNVLSGWTRNDIESTQNSLVKILVAAGKGTWIRRRSLKGVLWKTASLELLDYCLKYLAGKSAAGGMVVQTRHNPDCHDSEFRLIPEIFFHQEDVNAKYPSKEQLRQDLRFLFDSFLNPAMIDYFGPQPSREIIIDSATKLLDCKQFVKDFEIDKKSRNSPLAIHLSCHVVLSDQGRDEPPAIPPEELVLPLNATIADLKDGAARAFQDVYAMFTRFEVDKLLEYGPVEDSVTVKFLVGGRGSVKIKGTSSSKHALNEFRMERGTEKWVVDCECGAVDDDGERMMACDSCGVWHHIRCAGIDNSDEIPNKFVCLKCIIKFNKKFDKYSGMEEEPDTGSLSSSNSTCRVEAHGTNILRLRTSIQ